VFGLPRRQATDPVSPTDRLTRTCTSEDSPFHPFLPVCDGEKSPRSVAGKARSGYCGVWHRAPLWVSSLPLRVGSHTSSVKAGGLVSVSEPAVSNSGLAPGHLSERWGDFPHSQE